ncbi:MAG: MarR family winged helix-turn-helix transcriptional regulator [Ruminococcus sp.]|nr:MarR family winged helix-turn-helix transcriptional regulator [Ruminococcus sp.]
MERNSLSHDLMISIEKIYHYEPRFDIFYQGETKVLTFIARYQSQYQNHCLLPSDISKSLDMTSPRVSNILSTLEKKGYIKRDFSTVDRRKVYIYITEDGQKYVDDISIKSRALFDSMIEKLGEHDAKELVRIINRLT